MIYIYDMLVDSNTTMIRRYGAKYKLEQRFRMGDRQFYSFVAPGMEKILVVPAFVEMYREAEKIVNRFPKGKTADEYCEMIRKRINHYVTSEEFPNDESDNGIMIVFDCDFKDIRVQFEYMNNNLEIAKEFEIRDRNIFGNGIVVSMTNEEENQEG